MREALTVGQAIDRYIQQSRHEMGKTKAQVLGAVKNFAIADLDCLDIRPSDVVDFATELGGGGRQPQTVLDLSHLGSVFALPPEAEAVVARMPKTKPEIFPFSTDAISATFTRACKISVSRTFASTISATKGPPVSSRWAGRSRRWRP